MSHKCNICHLPGHNSRTCPKNRATSPIVSPEEPEEIADSSFSSTESPPPTTKTAAASEMPPLQVISDSPEPAGIPPAIDEDSAILADEITADLNNNDDLLQAVMDFSLNSTDDGKDEDYAPESEEAAAKTAPKKSKGSPPKKNNKKKPQGPPVRVFRDPSPKKTENAGSKSAASPPPAEVTQKPISPLMGGSYKQTRFYRPPARPIYPNHPNPPRNLVRRHPRFRSYGMNQSAQRIPFNQIHTNIPRDWRNQNQPIHHYSPPHIHSTNPHHQPGYPTPGLAPHQPEHAQHNHNFHSSLHGQQPPPASSSHSHTTPHQAHPQAPNPIPHAQPAPPATASSSSNSKFDSGTGIIRPAHASIMRMHNLGLRIAYAVAWSGGGGVFLSKSEAEISHATATAANSAPLPIHTCAAMQCNLMENEALAVNWVLTKTRPTPPPPTTTPPTSTTPSPPAVSASASEPPPAAGNTAPKTPHNSCNTCTPQSQTHTSPQEHSYQPTNNTNSPLPTQLLSAQLTQSPPPQPSPRNPVSTPRATLFSADEWSFSQEDILVRKCLLDPRFAPISIVTKTPDPNRLPYIAAPGSTKGLVVSGSDSGLQNMVIDPHTGTISIKPKHLPTLRLLDFPTFLSLMFRAIDMASRQKCIVGDRAAEAVRSLVRDLTRLYESLQWSSEPTDVWSFVAYLRFHHMVLLRELYTGFNSEQAFLSEARNRCQTAKYQLRQHQSNLSPLIHPPSKTASNTPKSSTSHSPENNQNRSSHWFVCPCCGVQNDHFSPTCPSQSQGPKPIPKYIQDSTKNAINTAPISASARANLLRMASSLYAKLEKSA